MFTAEWAALVNVRYKFDKAKNIQVTKYARMQLDYFLKPSNNFKNNHTIGAAFDVRELS